MYLFFDTETTGLPSSPSSDFRNWPRLVQLAWLLIDENHDIKSKYNYIVRPDGYRIPKRVVDIHGITMQRAYEEGIPVDQAIHRFLMDSNFADVLIAHNIAYDYGVVRGELLRKKIPDFLEKRKKFCTMTSKQVLDFCKSFRVNGSRQCPSLSELYYLCFNAHLEKAHDAMIDAEACADCFFELKRLGMF
ncbi:MAG: 3'-5' exonuclease [Candidatus Thermoplasmatota archaeon]|nr:3'-5' exonuclease [Candidatus Thermoplasmatota archaeon]